ncbi:Hypothetical protein, putative [Bodo saltans]|uniref:Uncharacterized protein n=1 Tax=Bodo saltans TaxID=75058 RepID=A0A0S4IP82_BODSA|nr:Hypothetical protein, putative [Bodo saltans]|eukprot:CUF02473.1 Hypothetical protein, putative [Bodo saltans]
MTPPATSVSTSRARVRLLPTHSHRPQSNLAAIPHVVESNDDNNIFTPPYSQGSKSGGGGNQQQQQAKQRQSVDTTNSTFNNSSTTVVGGIASLWNGAGPMVISGIVDIDLILRVVNAYCRPSSALEYNSDPQQQPPSSPSKVRFMNRRGKVVTLGDALSAFLLAGGKGQSTPQSDLELVPEFLDMTPHMRGLDRQRLLPQPSLQINGSTVSDVMSPQSTLQTTTMSVGGASIFSDGNDDRLAMMEDLSDAGEASILSPMSGGSSVVDMSASPYAAHGSPWKERTLNTETLKMHNKLVSAKESQMAKQVQLMTKAAQDAERRPKVLMQLLFGAQVWNSFWAAINRQLFGGNPQASTSSGGGAGGSDDGAFQSEEGDEA